MNISAPFIHRPVATTLLTAGVALCGAAAFMLLPVAPLPRIDVPAVFVSAQLPGASPEVMASTVATPLERHLGAISDVDDMTSSSGVGTTNIQLTFGVDRDIDGAARDVQAAIVAAHADLPTSLTRNPSYRKLNTSLFPVMAIAMTSDVLTQGQIYAEAVQMALAPKLGRDAAHTLVAGACRRAAAAGAHLRDILLAEPTVRGVLDRDAIDGLFDPTGYLGESSAYIERALIRHQESAD